MSELKGKLAVITGANTGIGKVTAREIAKAGARVILACRSEDKARAAMAEIEAAVPDAQLEFLKLDLSTLVSVREAAQSLVTRGEPIHLLINNAGLAGAKGLTTEGFELHFGVNHLGHHLWTQLLRPILANGGRVVCVASRAHRRSKGLDFDTFKQPTASRTGFPEYCDSKLANVLFVRKLAMELADRNIDVYGLHPGVVASDIWRRLPWPIRPLATMFMITNEQGAATSIHCATASSAKGQTGLYWDKCEAVPPHALGQDDAVMEELWRRSEEWTAQR